MYLNSNNGWTETIAKHQNAWGSHAISKNGRSIATITHSSLANDYENQILNLKAILSAFPMGHDQEMAWLGQPNILVNRELKTHRDQTGITNSQFRMKTTLSSLIYL